MSEDTNKIDESAVAAAFDLFEASGHAFEWTWSERRGRPREEVDEAFARGISAWLIVVGDMAPADYRRGVLAWLREGHPSDRTPTAGEVLRLARETSPDAVAVSVDAAWRVVLSLASAIGPSREYRVGGEVVDSSEEFERRLVRRFGGSVPPEVRSGLAAVGGRLGIMRLDSERSGFFSFRSAFEEAKRAEGARHLVALEASAPVKLLSKE